MKRKKNDTVIVFNSWGEELRTGQALWPRKANKSGCFILRKARKDYTCCYCGKEIPWGVYHASPAIWGGDDHACIDCVTKEFNYEIDPVTKEFHYKGVEQS